ncbi:hypothetical protein AJ80_05337 [Polytolypa hystricis UAMH7299]|uniref:Integral membrane protein n=1 Tax=Polytolypa hystricis (strain UAMH7299) TaxID=1447883 RepID=A0A2B7Y5G6_POLH7|nr:hypothetical protein AJ80_05337 [Polytolypa hystricis UAMH7299]
MASGLFFSPQKLLHLTPLITATSSLTYAHDENFYLSNFLYPAHQPLSNQILPSYFSRMFNTGVWIVIGTHAVNIGSAIATLVSLKNQTGGGSGILNSQAGKWYTAGLILSIAHFAFVPFVAYPVRDIVEDRSEGKSTGGLKRWLDVHRVRVLLVDLPCWMCFLAAALVV